MGRNSTTYASAIGGVGRGDTGCQRKRSNVWNRIRELSSQRFA